MKPSRGEGGYATWHPFWDVGILDHHSFSRHNGNGSLRTRYPVRTLRYWFMYHLICKEHLARRSPLTVCELGVGDGPMLAFLKRVESSPGRTLPPFLARWDAVSRRIRHTSLNELGYTACLEHNIEDGNPALCRQYDVIILLHILEHLHDPETTVQRLLASLKPGGLLIGECPGVPEVMRRSRERQLRNHAEPFGHVSALSPRRLKRLAGLHHLTIELLTGAYLFRMTGAFIENSRLWLRLNLLFGALVPAWPGELYWAMRKPERA